MGLELRTPRSRITVFLTEPARCPKDYSFLVRWKTIDLVTTVISIKNNWSTLNIIISIAFAKINLL